MMSTGRVLLNLTLQVGCETDVLYIETSMGYPVYDLTQAEACRGEVTNNRKGPVPYLLTP